MVALLRRHGLSGWRRHAKLPGRPDFVWPKHRVAVFVDGCFWHGHDCGRNRRARGMFSDPISLREIISDFIIRIGRRQTAIRFWSS